MSLIQVVSLSAGIHPDGALAGHPTVIARTGISDAGLDMAPHDLLAEAERLAGGPCLISLIGAGGPGSDPAIQPLEDLIQIGRMRGFRFAVETQGYEAPEWLEELDYLIVAPPPPSTDRVTDYRALHHAIGAGLAGRSRLSLKVAVACDADFAFAEMIHELFPPVDFYVTACTTALSAVPEAGIHDYVECARWIAEAVVERQQPDMRVSLNLAALLGVGGRV